MKHLLVSLLLLVSAVTTRAEIVTIQIPGAPPGLTITVGTGVNALPLQEIKNNPNAVNITSGDDDWRNVPLGFDFPFFGRVFNNSWAMTNGVVTFQDPVQSGAYGLCCAGVDLSTTTDPRYNYSIFGVHSDLYSWNGQNQYYLRENNNTMTYGWYGVSQCCSSQGGNSFEIKINSSGLVDTRIAGAMVQWNSVTSGMSGNLANGEYFQAYHGQGINITPGGPNIFSWQAPNGTGAVDMCIINPLSSPSCPGYQTAYTTQQCTINALFDPSCPGYASAYLTQQCSTNPLFSQMCPGYQAAYLQQQCSINPLYSTTCNGYQQAYHDQQCSVNTLYATDCPGYAQAYLTQQCSINPLYSTTCEGYQSAYLNQQCSANALYSTSCSGYNEAYFAQQCSLNGLYATTCPNYATAYATQQALIAVAPPSQSTTTTTTTEVITAPKIESSGEIKVALVADSNVNSVITTTATSASPAAAATATVPLVAPPPPPAAPVVEAKVEAKQEAKTEEKKAESSPSTSTTTTTASSDSKSSDSPKPTARQEIQAKREAAAKAKAVEDGKNLAGNMGKAADMEQQKAVQNVVIAAMGFTPGFDTYQVRMPDVVGYKPFTVYANQKNIDNRANLRMFGGTDKLHQEIVDSQYNRGN